MALHRMLVDLIQILGLVSLAHPIDLGQTIQGTSIIFIQTATIFLIAGIVAFSPSCLQVRFIMSWPSVLM